MSAKNPRAAQAVRDALGDHPPRGALTALANAAGVEPSTAQRWWSMASSPDPVYWPAIDAHLGTDLVRPETARSVSQHGDGEPQWVSLAQHVELAQKLDELTELVQGLDAAVKKLTRAGRRAAQ